MASTLSHLRALIAAIIVIASSGIATSMPGPIQRASGILVEFELANADSTRPAADASERAGFIGAASPASHHGDCPPDCGTKCAMSAGAACCAAAISLASRCNILDEDSIAAYAIRDGRFRLAGIEPEALLHPPQ
jgi:hypothetical protein